MIVVIAYVLYLAISIGITVWVAHTLSSHGHAFLVNNLGGNDDLADSLNHMLVVGFYLINIGYITLTLRSGQQPQDVQQVIEYLSSKIGLVLLILGAMHFLNLYVISRPRKWEPTTEE